MSNPLGERQDSFTNSPRNTNLPVRTGNTLPAQQVHHHLSIVEAPPRPGDASNSESYRLQANYFKVNVNIKECWRSDIRVELKPKDGDDKVRQPTGVKLKALVQKALKFLLKNNPYASDFKSSVVAIRKPHNLSHDVWDDNEPSKVYIVTLSEPRRIDIKGISDLLREMDNWKSKKSEDIDSLGAYTTPLDVLDVLGLVLSHTARVEEGIVTIGRSRFFDTKQQSSLKWLNKFEFTFKLLSGFWQSVRSGNGHFLLNVNVANAVFLPPINLAYYIKNSRWFHDQGNIGKYRALASRLTGASIKYTVGKKTQFKRIKGLPEKDQSVVYLKDQYFTFNTKRDKKGNLVGVSATLSKELENRSKGALHYEISVKDYLELRELTIIHLYPPHPTEN